MIQSMIAIAVGASLGAWCRWGLSLWLDPIHGRLSMGMLAANLVGAYMVGLALAWFAVHPSVSPPWRLFIVTGLLGGLTTFSAFSADTVRLLMREQYGWALITVLVHVLGSFALTAAGFASLRMLRSNATGLTL